MLNITDSVLAAPGIDKNESDIKTLQKLFLDIITFRVLEFEAWFWSFKKKKFLIPDPLE